MLLSSEQVYQSQGNSRDIPGDLGTDSEFELQNSESVPRSPEFI